MSESNKEINHVGSDTQATHDTDPKKDPVFYEAVTTATQRLSLGAAVEAILYVAGEPTTIAAIASALEVSATQIEEAVAALEQTLTDRGVRIQRMSNKLQLVSAPELSATVQKFLGVEGSNRLSAAALETLAIIAYKQPITKPQIEMVRGVNSDGVMHTLIQRNLVHEQGRTETVGHPMKYGVSFEFLQHFGLKGSDDLPMVEHIETLSVTDLERTRQIEASEP